MKPLHHITLTHTHSRTNTYTHLRHTQADRTLPRTASCPMALKGAPLSKLSVPTILRVHFCMVHSQSAADSCKISFNPVERCEITPTNLVAGVARIRCMQSLSPTPLKHDNGVTSSVGSVASLKITDMSIGF